jgi:hypothetical protein
VIVVKKKHIQAELFCLSCNDDSIHTIEYDHNLIVQISCVKCGRIIGSSGQTLITSTSHTDFTWVKEKIGIVRDEEISAKEFAEKLIQRIITKPSRLTDEMHYDLETFIRTIPTRVVTKPVRLAREISHLKRKHNL